MTNGDAFKHNATKVSADALYFGKEIQCWQSLYRICSQLLYRVSHDVIRKLRTLEEPFDLAQT